MALTHTNNTFSPVAEFHSNDNHSLLTISFWNPFNNIVDSMVMNGRMAAREHCQGIKKSFRELQEKPSKAVCFYCPDIRRWRMRHWRHVKVENAPIKRDPGQSWKFANFAKWLRHPKLPQIFDAAICTNKFSRNVSSLICIDLSFDGTAGTATTAKRFAVTHSRWVLQGSTKVGSNILLNDNHQTPWAYKLSYAQQTAANLNRRSSKEMQ